MNSERVSADMKAVSPSPMFPMLSFGAVVCGGALMCSVSAAESVFPVVVQERGTDAGSGQAVLIAEELLLINSGLVDAGDQFIVDDPATGARLVATLFDSDEDSGLALLSVPSLEGDPVPVAHEQSDPGRQVYLLIAGGEARSGAMHSHVERDGQLLYRFTSVVGEGETGAPLMNNCDELLAVSRSVQRPRREDGQLTLSGDLAALREFLDERSVSYTAADEACPSIEERLAAAEQERLRLEEERAALEQAANEAEEQNQERIAEIEAEQQALEERLQAQAAELEERQAQLAEKEETQRALEAEREQLEAQAEQLEADRQQQEEAAREAAEALARQQEEAAAARRIAWYSVGGGALALLLLAAFVRSRFRARQRRLDESEEELASAKETLERHTATFPDFVLHGRAPNGEDVRVKVNGDALARVEDGQVIGRSATDADHVVGVESVSRRHARLRVDGVTLTVEDLGSLNGTRLNGVELVKGSPTTVGAGSTLALGGVTLTVHFLGDGDGRAGG